MISGPLGLTTHCDYVHASKYWPVKGDYSPQTWKKDDDIVIWLLSFYYEWCGPHIWFFCKQGPQHDPPNKAFDLLYFVHFTALINMLADDIPHTSNDCRRMFLYSIQDNAGMIHLQIISQLVIRNKSFCLHFNSALLWQYYMQFSLHIETVRSPIAIADFLECNCRLFLLQRKEHKRTAHQW